MIDTEELQRDVDKVLNLGNSMYQDEFCFRRAVVVLLLGIVQRLDAIKEENVSHL